MPEPQEGAGGQGPAGTGEGQGGGDAGGDQSGTGSAGTGAPGGPSGGPAAPPADFVRDYDPARAYATIQAQREAERAARTELAAAQARVREYEQAQMTETERNAARVADLERTNTEKDEQLARLRLENVATSEATRLRFRNPAVAVRLLTPADVKYDAEGNPTNVGALMDELLRREPYLAGPAGPGPGDGGAGREGDGGEGSGGMTGIIRREVAARQGRGT